MIELLFYLSSVGDKPQLAEKNVKVTPKAKALFDFDGEFDDELSFKVNVEMLIFPWNSLGEETHFRRWLQLLLVSHDRNNCFVKQNNMA